MSQISELEKNEIYMHIDKRFYDYMKARIQHIDQDSYKYELFNILVKMVIEPAGFRVEHFRGYTAQEKIEKTLYCCRKIGLDQFNTESVLLIWSDDALKLIDI